MLYQSLARVGLTCYLTECFVWKNFEEKKQAHKQSIWKLLAIFAKSSYLKWKLKEKDETSKPWSFKKLVPSIFVLLVKLTNIG